MIGSPAERVFRFVADLETWPQWHGSGQVVEKTTPGPVDVGTTWKVTGQVQGRPVAMTIEPNSKFGFKTTSGPIQAYQEFSFEAVAAGTRLTTALELANPELAAHARRQWDNDLLILKELLEAKTQQTLMSKGSDSRWSRTEAGEVVSLRGHVRRLRVADMVGGPGGLLPDTSKSEVARRARS